MTNEKMIKTLKEILLREKTEDGLTKLSFETVADISHLIDTLEEKEKTKKKMLTSMENYLKEL